MSYNHVERSADAERLGLSALHLVIPARSPRDEFSLGSTDCKLPDFGAAHSVHRDAINYWCLDRNFNWN